MLFRDNEQSDIVGPDLELREPPAAVARAQAIGMHSHRLAGRHARRMDGRALRAIVAVDLQGARPAGDGLAAARYL